MTRLRPAHRLTAVIPAKAGIQRLSGAAPPACPAHSNENPGGSNERYARATFKQAKIVMFDDNTTIFDEILKGREDVMISESVEAKVQQKLRPGLCAVNPDKRLQYGEMAYRLPRGDVAFKTGVDQWLHLARENGDYERTLAAWIK
ncbi:MAG: transporter substrate-binding domain-containing protein [Casimicrobiaceae bacterium]